MTRLCDEASGRNYYYHVTTLETSWEHPGKNLVTPPRAPQPPNRQDLATSKNAPTLAAAMGPERCMPLRDGPVEAPIEKQVMRRDGESVSVTGHNRRSGDNGVVDAFKSSTSTTRMNIDVARYKPGEAFRQKGKKRTKEEDARVVEGRDAGAFEAATLRQKGECGTWRQQGYHHHGCPRRHGPVTTGAKDNKLRILASVRACRRKRKREARSCFWIRVDFVQGAFVSGTRSP